MGYQHKYNASPFDPGDVRDARSELARKAVINAYIECMDSAKVGDGEALQDIAGGLLIGLVCIIASHAPQTDENHASIRAGILELVPWAVDMVRAMHDLPPLSDGN